MRHVRPQSGLRCSHGLSFQIASLPLGGGVPPRCIGEMTEIVKELRRITCDSMIFACNPGKQSGPGPSSADRAVSKSQRHADMTPPKSEPVIETLGIDSACGSAVRPACNPAAGLGDRPLHHLLSDAAAAHGRRRERPRSGRARRLANSTRAGRRAAGSRPRRPRRLGDQKWIFGSPSSASNAWK